MKHQNAGGGNPSTSACNGGGVVCFFAPKACFRTRSTNDMQLRRSTLKGLFSDEIHKIKKKKRKKKRTIGVIGKNFLLLIALHCINFLIFLYSSFISEASPSALAPPVNIW
ncbi:hypothetical protein QG37_00092 [Candidozyma auris]|nr:hypothetical protein QG37_00092 [[Candida] auris]